MTTYEKWNATGLLDSAINKEALAEMLERFSQYLVFSESDSSNIKNMKSYAAIMLFPIVVKTFSDINFSFLTEEEISKYRTSKSFLAKCVDVKLVDGEESQINECNEVSNKFKLSLDGRDNLTINKVEVVFNDSLFYIGIIYLE